MIDLNALWRDARSDAKVCSETGATKNMVLNAITDGAKSWDDVAKSVQLCGGSQCALRNPSGIGCRENVQALLDVYVPIFEMMSAGGGCHHEHPAPKPSDCSGKKSGGCGGCTGCGG